MSADPLDVLREAPALFLLLDGILSVDAAELTAWRQAGELPFFLALEAAAQAAALHQRWLADFGAHAFLLSLGSCRWPSAPLSGRLEIRARLQGRSAGAAAYAVSLCLPQRPPAVLQAHIGLIPYDAAFRRDVLRAHYRALFQRLSRGRDATPV